MDECATLPFDDPAPPEEWRPVVGWEGHYEVSDLGRIRTLKRSRKQGKPFTKDPDGFLAYELNWAGYFYVTLRRPEHRRVLVVHRLVAAAFIGPCPPGLVVRHLDGDPANCAATNLAYGTRGENNLDSVLHGTHPEARRTHCNKGHEFTPENTVYRKDSTGGRARRCLTCKRAMSRENNRRIWARKKAARDAAAA